MVRFRGIFNRRYYWAHEYQVIIQIAQSAEGYRAGSWRDGPFRERESVFVRGKKPTFDSTISEVCDLFSNHLLVVDLSLSNAGSYVQMHSLQLNGKRKCIIRPLIIITLSLSFRRKQDCFPPSAFTITGIYIEIDRFDVGSGVLSSHVACDCDQN